jgi:hypothetical protein
MTDMVIGDYDAAVTIDGSTNYLLIQPGNASTAYKKINRETLLGITAQPVGTTTSQTLTNKTIGITNTITQSDALFTLQDNSDNTKQAQFQLSGITTATTRTYTLPNASSTLADIATAQTFTNKTLTSPVITGGTIANSTITVDSIAGYSAASTVTVAGLQIVSGVLNTNNSVVTANIADNAVTSAKISSFSYSNSTISNPYKFSAYKSSTTQTVNTGSATIVVFDVEEFDTNNNFASNTYTAPVTGYYYFTAALNYNAVGSGTRLQIAFYKNGVDVKEGDDRFTNAAQGAAHGSALIPMTAGDTMDVRATPVGANTVLRNNSIGTFFQGILMSQT